MKKTYIVDSTCNDMRIDRWIRNLLGKVPQSLIEKYLRAGKIKLNKKKIKSSCKVKINDQIDLSALYSNCFAYIHGHEFGGTNPTMINALDLNCQILALNTVFNREMLRNKNLVFFNKNENSIKEKINEFEDRYEEFIKKNSNYKLLKKYNWNFIVKQYSEIFKKLTNYQNK